VLLWRIRRVFQDYSREYEIIVYDDGSTDGTRETVEPYAEVIPLTVMRGEERKGFGFALDKLVREVSRRTRYARRDGLIVMQADFTDQPEHIPELVKRFEGGADIVAASQAMSEAPAPVRRLRQFASLIQRAGLPKTGDADPFTTFRLYRISVLRELLKVLGDKPLVSHDGWAANMELLLKARKFARRTETVDLAPRYDEAIAANDESLATNILYYALRTYLHDPSGPGRMTAPDRLCPPQVLAFSMTATGTSPRRSIVSGSSASRRCVRPAIPWLVSFDWTICPPIAEKVESNERISDRDALQLYLHAHFLKLARENPQFRYVPVISDEKAAPGFRTGFIGDAVSARNIHAAIYDALRLCKDL